MACCLLAAKLFKQDVATSVCAENHKWVFTTGIAQALLLSTAGKSIKQKLLISKVVHIKHMKERGKKREKEREIEREEGIEKKR